MNTVGIGPQLLAPTTVLPRTGSRNVEDPATQPCSWTSTGNVANPTCSAEMAPGTPAVLAATPLTAHSLRVVSVASGAPAATQVHVTATVLRLSGVTTAVSVTASMCSPDCPVPSTTPPPTSTPVADAVAAAGVSSTALVATSPMAPTSGNRTFIAPS